MTFVPPYFIEKKKTGCLYKPVLYVKLPVEISII